MMQTWSGVATVCLYSSEQDNKVIGSQMEEKKDWTEWKGTFEIIVQALFSQEKSMKAEPLVMTVDIIGSCL